VRLTQGLRQPADQRGQVHRGRRPHRGVGACWTSIASPVVLQDSGIGIPQDMLSRVFDMFTQVAVRAVRFAGRAGHRPHAGAPAGRTARRPRVGVQPGRAWAAPSP
jgi:hypothetical protein